MNTFISHSGGYSKQVAELFSGWLQCVIQAVEPVISGSADRDDFWFSQAQPARNIDVVLLCLTNDNKDAGSVYFDAACFYKELGLNKVYAFLVDIDPNKLTGPLKHFRQLLPVRNHIWSLVMQINSGLKERGLKENVLQKVFNVYWPEFEKDFGSIVDHSVTRQQHNVTSQNSGYIQPMGEFSRMPETSRMEQANNSKQGKTTAPTAAYAEPIGTAEQSKASDNDGYGSDRINTNTQPVNGQAHSMHHGTDNSIAEHEAETMEMTGNQGQASMHNNGWNAPESSTSPVVSANADDTMGSPEVSPAYREGLLNSMPNEGQKVLHEVNQSYANNQASASAFGAHIPEQLVSNAAHNGTSPINNAINNVVSTAPSETTSTKKRVNKDIMETTAPVQSNSITAPDNTAPFQQSLNETQALPVASQGSAAATQGTYVERMPYNETKKETAQPTAAAKKEQPAAKAADVEVKAPENISTKPSKKESAATKPVAPVADTVVAEPEPEKMDEMRNTIKQLEDRLKEAETKKTSKSDEKEVGKTSFRTAHRLVKDYMSKGLPREVILQLMAERGFLRGYILETIREIEAE